MNKRILVFGDSNTWGWRPDNQMFDRIRRWNDEERFTGVMQKELGDNYTVITEGLSARTTVWDDPIEGDRCGMRHLFPLMDTHSPLDLIIIFLGSNDLKTRFSVTVQDVGQSVGKLVQMASSRTAAFAGKARVLVIAPPAFHPAIEHSMHAKAFEGGEEKSRSLAWHIGLWAKASEADFLDAGEFISSSKTDGLHLDKEAHEILGKAVADKTRQILG